MVMKKISVFKYDSEDNVVRALYKIGLIIFVPLVILFFFLRTDTAVDYLLNGGYYCTFKSATGLNCPGCGGTRASLYLARLDVVNSFKMNATVIVSVILYLFFMIKETLHRVFGFKGIKEWQVYVLIAIFVATVVIRWIVCNFVFVL